MTLEGLKDYFKTISLKHKDVNDFKMGSWYDAATSTAKYPMVWWEVPYFINYNADFPKGIDTVTISFSVFHTTKRDDISDSHQVISICKTIGDAIITKARIEGTGFKIQSVNSVSVREYSDDDVSGMRYDLTLLLQRDICEAEIGDYFNDCDE